MNISKTNFKLNRKDYPTKNEGNRGSKMYFFEISVQESLKPTQNQLHKSGTNIINEKN